MLTKEIRDKAKLAHDNLTKNFYQKKRSEDGITQAEQSEFDIQHAKIWADMEAEIKLTDDYISPIPPRDLAMEIASLKTRIEVIENTPFVIKT